MKQVTAYQTENGRVFSSAKSAVASELEHLLDIDGNYVTSSAFFDVIVDNRDEVIRLLQQLSATNDRPGMNTGGL